MRAEEQAQQAEAQITMFELLRYLPVQDGLSNLLIKYFWKVADPTNASHHCHHDAAFSAGWLHHSHMIPHTHASFHHWWDWLHHSHLIPHTVSFQLSGINAVFYYSTNLFITTGLSETSAKYATIGIGSVMVLMTLVSIPLMDRSLMRIIMRRGDKNHHFRSGRRTLHLYGLGGMFIFSIFITISFLVKVIILNIPSFTSMLSGVKLMLSPLWNSYIFNQLWSWTETTGKQIFTPRKMLSLCMRTNSFCYHSRLKCLCRSLWVGFGGCR